MTKMREEMLAGEREGHGQPRHDQSPPFTLQDQEDKLKKGRADQIFYTLDILGITPCSVTV